MPEEAVVWLRVVVGVSVCLGRLVPWVCRASHCKIRKW